MTPVEKIILGLVIPVLWNVISMLFFLREIQRKTLTPQKFSAILIFSFGITISFILFIAFSITDNLNPHAIAVILFALFLNICLGFPVVYLLSKGYLQKQIQKWMQRK